MRVLCVEDSSAKAQAIKERHVERMVAQAYGHGYLGRQRLIRALQAPFVSRALICDNRIVRRVVYRCVDFCKHCIVLMLCSLFSTVQLSVLVRDTRSHARGKDNCGEHLARKYTAEGRSHTTCAASHIHATRARFHGGG